RNDRPATSGGRLFPLLRREGEAVVAVRRLIDPRGRWLSEETEQQQSPANQQVQQAETTTRERSDHTGSITPSYQGRDGKRDSNQREQNAHGTGSEKQAEPLGRGQAEGHLWHDKSGQAAEEGEVGQA